MNYYTYDVDYNQSVDMGAQYHRIVTIYCLVKYLNSKNPASNGKLFYVHNKIEPDTSGIDQHFGLSRFVPGKFGIPTEFDDVQYENRPTYETLQMFYQKPGNMHTRTVLEIGFPEDVMKNHPEIYSENTLKELQGYINTATAVKTAEFSTKKNIVIHIADENEAPAYYLGLIDTMNKLYGLDDSNICILATEIKKGALDAYRKKKNTQVLANLEFLQMFQYMSTCDVLVMSPTSTAYLAALYNSTAKDIYYRDNVYPSLPAWKNITTIISNTSIVQGFQNQTEEETVTESFTSEFMSQQNDALSIWIGVFLLVFTFVLFIYFTVDVSSFSVDWRTFRKFMFRIIR